MKKVTKWIFVFSLATLSSSLFAYVPIADTLLGEAIDKTLLIAGKSSLPQFQKYKIIHDPNGVAKIQQIVKNITIFSKQPFRYKTPVIRIIKGNHLEANAFSLGRAIYVTQEALKILEENELTAVIAHEMAHREFGHYLARMVYTTGSPILHLRNLIFSEIYYLTTGEADDYLRQVMENGQLSLIQEILGGASLRQEMQSDCVAANWLERARLQGYNLHPLDLNRATNKIMGMDIGEIVKYDETNPVVIRYLAVQSGRYLGGRCLL
ncbi:MAG: M48 family metalloprotease [Bacteriovorax sp.]|nr:M48 family metalloprotease [Bacteriovorax sp.]